MSSDKSSINAQEHQRLRKALRESELLRELAELLASSLDLTRILHVLVRRTTEVCEVERCAVWLYNESERRFRPSAYHLSAPHLSSKEVQLADRIWHNSSVSYDNPVIEQLLREGGMLYIEDLRQAENEEMRTIASKFLVHSFLQIALIREGRTVGMMSLDQPGQRHAFSAEQLQLARAIGQQAAVAIDNARLYQEAQSERRRAELLAQRSQGIHQVALAINMGEDLARIIELATRLLEQGLETEGIAVSLFKGEHLQVVNTLGLNASQTLSNVGAPRLNDLPACSKAVEQGRPVFIYHEQLTAHEKGWLEPLGLLNVLIVPLIVGKHSSNEHVISQPHHFATRSCAGFAFVNYRTPPAELPTEHLTFAQDIATQCALALERDHMLSTSRHVASLALERANTLDAVFNALNEGISVLDMQGKVMMRNNSATQILAHNAIPPTGEKPPEYLPDLFLTQTVYTLQGRALGVEEQPLVRGLRGEQIRGERIMTRRSDSTERIIELNIVPLLGPAPSNATQQIGLVSAFRDVTEQVQAEQRIRRALDTMLHAAEAISGVTKIEEILQRTLEMTLNMLSCQRGAVHLYQEETQEFTPLTYNGVTDEEKEVWLAEQRRWLSPSDRPHSSIVAQLLQGHAVLMQPELPQELQTPFYWLAAPITYNDRLLGVLLLERTFLERTQALQPAVKSNGQVAGNFPFTLWDVAVLEGIAQFAGLAIEQARWQYEAERARLQEEALQASNALKDEFLALTAHEFRTPLTLILGHSQMMERTLRRFPPEEWPERLRENIENIEMQTRQLTNIVNTFLEVTQLNRGQIVLHKELLDLEEIASQMITQYTPTTEKHHLSYRSRATRKPYFVLGDRARIQQIFTNLLQNALKYSPRGGPISLSLRQIHNKTQGKDEPLIEVRIQDKGIGVPKEAQQRLFESFYRAPNVKIADKASGVGLGLYVVAEFLRLHDGTIRVESSGVDGEGSSFILTLPLFIPDESETTKIERIT